MPRFTTKPVTFDAIKIPAAGSDFDAGSVSDLEWVLDAALNGALRRTEAGFSLTVADQGLLHGTPGDWLMRGSDGGMTICQAATFDEHYEAAPAASPPPAAAPTS